LTLSLQRIFLAREKIAERRVARFSLLQHTKTGKNKPNDHKIYPNGHKIDQMAVKWTKWPQNISTTTRPSNIYPKWDFWFENIQSGNPVELFFLHNFADRDEEKSFFSVFCGFHRNLLIGKSLTAFRHTHRGPVL
jgi:hypothetical protein